MPKRIYRHAFRLTHHRPDAEGWPGRPSYQSSAVWRNYTPGTFEGRLRRTTVNLLLDQQRRHRGSMVDPLASHADRRKYGVSRIELLLSASEIHAAMGVVERSCFAIATFLRRPCISAKRNLRVRGTEMAM